MSFKNSLLITFISLLILSCSDQYKFELSTPKKLSINSKLTISISEKNNKPIDSVSISIDNNPIVLDDNLMAELDINSYRLGRHKITAIVFYASKTKKLTNTVYFLADKGPDMYDFKIVNSYPHDRSAYTQGLEYHNGFLYESTGKRGRSSLRKVELESGKVLRQIDLDKQYFGEGITRLNEKIFMLTWEKGIGFVYDIETFEQLSTFKYKNSIQGWGLANDGNRLIKTDGSERIWFLNAETQHEEGFIEAYTNKRKVENLNELEYVEGKIYANIYQENTILIIDPTSGKIDGVANLNKLKEEMEKTQKLVTQDEVLNGIAYDSTNKRLFVTGKNWGKLFEIELIKKN